MLDLILFPFHLAFGIIKAVFGLIGGFFSLIFGLLGGVLSLAVSAAVIGLIRFPDCGGGAPPGA